MGINEAAPSTDVANETAPIDFAGLKVRVSNLIPNDAVLMVKDEVTCIKIVDAMNEIADLKAQLAEKDNAYEGLKFIMETKLAEKVEDEGSCCPEDVGFKEYIGVLTKRIAELAALLKEADSGMYYGSAEDRQLLSDRIKAAQEGREM